MRRAWTFARDEGYLVVLLAVAIQGVAQAGFQIQSAILGGVFIIVLTRIADAVSARVRRRMVQEAAGSRRILINGEPAYTQSELDLLVNKARNDAVEKAAQRIREGQ